MAMTVVYIDLLFLLNLVANYLLLQSASANASLESPWLVKILSTELWRGMLGLGIIPSLLFVIVIFFIPESPRWLLLRNRRTAAGRIMSRIYGSPEETAAQIEATEQAIAQSTGNEWSLLLRPGIRKALLIGVSIAILGQFMGVNAVLYYGPTIFEQSGLSGGDSLFYQVMVGMVNMLTTVLALFIIDRIGR